MNLIDEQEGSVFHEDGRIPGTSYQATSFARIVDRLPPGRFWIELVKEDAPTRMSSWKVSIQPLQQPAMVLRRTDD